MSLLIVAFALLLNNGVGTLPIFARDESAELTGPPRPSDGHFMGRSLYNIMWNCFTTIFICTWVSVHPNIPAPGESPLKALWTRIKLMLWTLIMPELIFTWAVKQWLAAREIAERYKGRGWGELHAHFFIMGGFKLVVPNDDVMTPSTTKPPDLEHPENPIYLDLQNSDRITLSVDQFQQLVQESKIVFPSVTVSEIRDKSKGDFLSKTIAVLQMFWFVVQCIARRMQNLALTQFELVTLALACLNAVTTFFWWHKPLGVSEAIPVYFRGTFPKEPEEPSTNTEATSNHATSSDGFFSSMGTTFRGMTKKVMSFSILCLRNCRDAVKEYHVVAPLLPLYYGVQFLYQTVKKFVKSLGDIALTNDIPDDATHVPTFYAPDTDMTDVAIFLLLPVFAAVFGGLHCIGWNFEYPTQVEQTTWRVTSAMTTAIPFATIFIFCMNTVCRAERHTLDYPAYILIVIYVLARSSLLVQALVLLRLQPASIYRTVDWTKFLFHTA